MLILAILFFLTALGLYMQIKFYRGTVGEIIGLILALLCFILFISGIILLPIHQYSNRAAIKEFEITRQTYKNMRNNLKNNHIIESAAIQMDIAKMNRWLANKKYWNNTIFDIWIPDEINKLKPIR